MLIRIRMNCSTTKHVQHLLFRIHAHLMVVNQIRSSVILQTNVSYGVLYTTLVQIQPTYRSIVTDLHPLVDMRQILIEIRI
jgi:hypothetical protein